MLLQLDDQGGLEIYSEDQQIFSSDLLSDGHSKNREAGETKEDTEKDR